MMAITDIQDLQHQEVPSIDFTKIGITTDMFII
jgi:hypothetical protein